MQDIHVGLHTQKFSYPVLVETVRNHPSNKYIQYTPESQYFPFLHVMQKYYADN